jgi:GH15 family glucan-1,4-alpha-glucosidase
VPKTLEHYGLIGDLHTAAMVSDEGAIEWLCIPRFDSDACFAALLGDEKNGHFTIRPATAYRESSQRYQRDTLVLETEFVTDSGRVKLIDFMPIRESHARIVRIVEGLEGQVEMSVELVLRFDYGLTIPWARRTEDGIVYVSGPYAACFQSEAEVVGRNQTTVGTFTISKGERKRFVLVFYDSTGVVPPEIMPEVELARVREFWRSWVAGTHSDYGDYDNCVRRSLITLKALTYAPTGGIVAALTTSLPEVIGGSRNWDYRFCWLRDAAFALYAFLQRGHGVEARSWRAWLLRAVAGYADQLQIMYGLAGERRIPELELDWLPGYMGSKPVRIGNAASGQFQLDVYGEVADVLYQMLVAGIRHDGNAWEIQKYLTNHVVSVWEEPDDGIWEIRGERQHFTHSKIMAWVALDRSIKSLELLGADGPKDLWMEVRDRIKDRVLKEGYNESVGAFTQAFGSDKLDAAVLLAPIVGFIDANDPKMVSTVERIRKDLTIEGFVMRYRAEAGVDGIGEPEGVFLPCSFWLVENLALQNRLDEAQELLHKLISTANPLGIFTEEYDPVNKVMLGNFAQAFTHVGLVNAVRRVIDAIERQPVG